MTFKIIFSFIFISLLTASCKESTDDLLDKALALYKDKKYDEAITIYDKVIEKNNKFQLAYYNRGHCFLHLKNYSKALEDFNKVMDLQTYGDMVLTYNKDLPGADEEVRGQIPYMEALYERAQTKYFMDSARSAFIDFQTCIDNNYEASNCRLWQGTLLVREGKKDKACKYFQKALELAKDKDDQVQADTMIQAYCNK